MFNSCCCYVDCMFGILRKVNLVQMGLEVVEFNADDITEVTGVVDVQLFGHFNRNAKNCC